MDNIDKIIDEVLNELEIGVVKTEVKYRMKIHSKTSSHFETTPTLNIKDKQAFYNNIKEYVLLFEPVYKYLSEKDEYIKRTIALMFANMSLDDFNNPNKYIKKIINFRKNPILDDKKYNYASFDSNLEIKIKPYSYETPFCFECTLSNENDSYLLPTIAYGISDNVCYIYAIQDYNKHEPTPYHNKIKRRLYKLNDKVYDNESVEYKEYKNLQSEYYPENISDVSPGAVLSLSIFLKEIQAKGINNVQIIPYLPVRYNNKINVLAFKAIKYARENNLNENEKRKYYLDLINKQINNQNNITQKFIRTFYRVAYHFKNIKITSLPMELDDSLHITLSKFEHSDNEILNEIINFAPNKINLK